VFLVRINNSTQELTGQEALDYQRARPGPESQFWALAGGTWSGPAGPRLAGRAPVLLSMTQASPQATVWAAGFAGKAGVIAAHAPGPARQ
jgi:hypothetical protein